MFAKVLILALAAAVHCQYINQYSTGLGYGYGTGLGYGNGLGYGTGLGSGLYGGLAGVGGIPVYRSSALQGGLYGANPYGYGANYGRVAGLGALRTTGAIVGGGAFGYGTGALVSPALSTVGVAAPALSTVGLTGLNTGLNTGFAQNHLANLNIARGVSVQQAGPITAAVQTISRTVDYRPVPYTGEPAVVQDIDVPPQESPLRINFQSKSSPLAITQQHIPAEPGQVQVTQSEDEPQQAIHNVNRPVIQQVNEVIQPYRSLTQVVEPVIEQTHTNIAQGEGVRLTGLTSGVVGGTGVLAASGVGVAGQAIGYPALSSGAVVARPTLGLGLAQGYGVRQAGLYGTGLYGSGLYGAGLGLYGNRAGLGQYGNRVYGTGLYGTGVNTGLGLAGGYRTLGYGYGNGLALNGLSGLSTYGTTARINRIGY